jgi:hypothetical protein
MRIAKLRTALAGSAGLLIAACGSGGETANNVETGLGNAEIGNMGDPSAVEMLSNAANPTEPLGNAGEALGNGSAPTSGSNGSGNGSAPASTGPAGSTPPGGDMGGNTSSNRM